MSKEEQPPLSIGGGAPARAITVEISGKGDKTKVTPVSDAEPGTPRHREVTEGIDAINGPPPEPVSDGKADPKPAEPAASAKTTTKE